MGINYVLRGIWFVGIFRKFLKSFDWFLSTEFGDFLFLVVVSLFDGFCFSCSFFFGGLLRGIGRRSCLLKGSFDYDLLGRSRS